jgi:maltose/moltooligosaccharide transporter
MKKPTLSLKEIINMSFGFMGIQFGFGLQNANVSRIFQTLGANIDDIPILWIAGPVTGLLVQPIIGFMSDRTWNRFGRRRPYFFVGAILTTLALVVMPNSPVLWFAAIMLWILDASINISMEPFRAFVGDNLPSEQRTTGFAAQVFFIGIGAVLSSILPWIFTQMGVSNTAAEGIIPDTVKYSFYIGAVALLFSVLWTVFKSKEYSPEELKAFEEEEKGKEFEPEEWSQSDFNTNGTRQQKYGIVAVLIGCVLAYWFMSQGLAKELNILSFGVIAYGLLLLLSGVLQKSGKTTSAFVTIMNDLQLMPKTMKQLAIVQFFSWFALFTMWIYTTSAVTAHIYGTTDTTSTLYNDGANWVGWCFAVYNGVAALVAFLLPVMAKRTSRKTTHFICLLFGALGLASVYFISNPNLLLVSMIGIGFAWASILSMPYAILTGSIASSKMGYYMGVFNFFIVIPQIVAAAILGFFVSQFFDGQAILALFIGGISFVIAAFFTLFVVDKDDVYAS